MNRWKVVAALGLLVLVGGVYHGAAHNGFHFDDGPNITDHDPVHMRVWSVDALKLAAQRPAMSNRALPSITFAIDWWRGGGTPEPFQQTNVLIHLLTVLIVFLLLELVLRLAGIRELRALTVAFAVALLWGAHPIQIQAVTFIVQRMTALAGLFATASVYAYLRGRISQHQGGRVLWFGLTGLALFLGGISKEITWVAPILWLLAEHTVLRGREPAVRRGHDVLMLAIPVLVGLLLLVSMLVEWGPFAGVLNGYGARDFTLGERLLTQARVAVFYLSLLLWPAPSRLSILHDVETSTSLFAPWTTVFAVAAVFAFVGWGVKMFFERRKRDTSSAVAFFWLWIPVTMAMESSFVPLEMVYEHRVYWPSVGAAGLLALGITRLLDLPYPRIARILMGAAVVSSVALGACTVQRLQAWRTEETLWTDTQSKYPDLARPNTNLGRVYWDAGRREEAVALYERALRRDPNQVDTLLNLARSYRTFKRFGKVEPLYIRALGLQPYRAEVHFSLGMFYIEQRRYQQGIAHMQKTLHLNANYPQAAMFLGYAQKKLAAGAR